MLLISSNLGYDFIESVLLNQRRGGEEGKRKEGGEGKKRRGKETYIQKEWNFGCQLQSPFFLF